ncbi:MAG: indoleamine 2,3-dioxygenase [Minwuia sp.]|uniref:indoleamine 2,3-dioxygenase n=1 Tax=Minwuia sp. TaxID=2493630 RepID=UPI003A8B0BD2
MNIIDTDLRLGDFGITPERGFLSAFNPDETALPESMSTVRDHAMALPRLLPTGDVRRRLRAIPAPDMDAFLAEADEAQRRIAMVHLSFLIQAWVWGEPEAPRSLPANLAAPVWRLAEAIGQPPLLPYSGYVLDNWGRIDADGPITLENVYMIQQFLGGQDENWFVTIHVAIEAAAGALLAEVPGLIRAADRGEMDLMEDHLAVMAGVWEKMIAIFDRMPERCDPYIYFNRVRPWIHGWKDNPALGEGLVYEGVTDAEGRPQSFRGQTGSQSSIVPTVDALLGVGHAHDPLRSFLDELHAYRPPQHRRFIDAVRARSTVRQRLEHDGSVSQKEAYNANVQALARFRTRHLEYAASYINRQNRDAAGNDTEVGTGGTPFMKYLKKHRDEAERHLLR